ncbi:hypothetical protein BDY21DRAFT_88260 [Lineolata rhizophorae]|uniref:choline-phosphate cytidylyltransferase n=1 Tax=Lineolata rhizophorae TaxID=578093 RepID=A0A6A6PBZ4_9PEZI|nr:hypothetical protein BDY21DRAFT_88260 [Lineolata rhizophorae]
MPPKRKRANTAASRAAALENPPQPSSRDASEEDAEDLVLQEVTRHKQTEATAASNTNNPPSKRTRASIWAENNAADVDDQNIETSEADDAQQGAETRLSKPGRRSTRSSMSKAGEAKVDDPLDQGEGGERGAMRMEDPPKAGLVDPKGYRTNPPPTDRPVRVYADGVFDLFHLGHMRQLQQAKLAFPNTYLIVGVTGDKETHRRKGLTVLSAKERAESVRHCKWVDEVVEDCPWIIADAPEFMEKYKIDYVAHDDIPYGADEGDDIYSPIKKQGKFLVTQRTEGVSTTGIITKIVRDYEKYISRQLKRGTPRQELNVSWLKKNELEIKRTMGELRDNIRTNWTTTGQEIGRDLRQFLQSSRPASPARTPGREVSDPMTSPKERVATAGSPSTPSAVAHLSHLDIPNRASNSNGSGSSDFAAGYSLGLIGSVRSWMSKSKRTLNDSRPESPGSETDSTSGEKSAEADASRGRQGKHVQEEVDAQVVDEMDLRS